MSTTNNIRFRTSATDKKGNSVIIDIRLNDECKNGHEDFSITGSIYEKGKPHTDKYCLGCGCIHEAIEKAAPQLVPFIRLHLSDANGIPMYAVANGLHHMQNGFNGTPNTHPKFPTKFCEYYRINAEQFAQLSKAHNKIQYALSLEKLGILEQWKAEAIEATKQLEELTGMKFESAAVRSNYDRPTDAEIAEHEEKVKSGFYSEVQIEQRKEQAKRDLIEKMREDLKKTVDKETLKTNIQIRVFEIGGKIAHDNSIFYNHSNELNFNWKSYEKQVQAETIEAVREALKIEFPAVTVGVDKRK